MGYLRLIWFTLAGIVVGYLLMHTFAMLAYVLDPQHPQASLGFNIWKRQMRLAFSREMLAMGGAFAFMGGISGFFLGAWSLQKERWLAERLESQKRWSLWKLRRSNGNAGSLHPQLQYGDRRVQCASIEVHFG
jgi:hypothetical protein